MTATRVLAAPAVVAWHRHCAAMVKPLRDRPRCELSATSRERCALVRMSGLGCGFNRPMQRIGPAFRSVDSEPIRDLKSRPASRRRRDERAAELRRGHRLLEAPSACNHENGGLPSESALPDEQELVQQTPMSPEGGALERHCSSIDTFLVGSQIFISPGLRLFQAA